MECTFLIHASLIPSHIQSNTPNANELRTHKSNTHNASELRTHVYSIQSNTPNASDLRTLTRKYSQITANTQIQSNNCKHKYSQIHLMQVNCVHTNTVKYTHHKCTVYTHVQSNTPNAKELRTYDYNQIHQMQASFVYLVEWMTD